MDNSKDATQEKRDSNENITPTKCEQNQVKPQRNDANINVFLLICIVGVSLGILLEILNVQRNKTVSKDYVADRPKYWVFSANSDVESKTGLLKHVHLVLERIGYEKSSNESPWNLLWSHDYPFRVLFPHLHGLKPHQKVNHFPGTGFITHKVDLATTDSKYIPKAFKLPKNKDEFLKYAAKNKNALFMEKHNQHRGVHLKNVSEINLTSGESFVQEYVQNPFLVDGHKFDIGVYVVLTSVDPLRVYWYKGDVLFRYCPAKYHPLDPKNLDKYVIADDYLPTWEVPSLAHAYNSLGFSMKDAFDMYARSKGKDTSKMWEDIQDAIAELFLKKEKHIIEALKNYPSKENFFELMRFDLMVDEDLQVYLLEANMSPNLSSAHFPPNQLLYEQVLYSLFSLTGVRIPAVQAGSSSVNIAAQNMVSAQKNIAVWGEECTTICKEDCKAAICGVCRPCLSEGTRRALLRAHTEYLHQGDFRRLYPPAMKQNSPPELKNSTEMNKLQHLWFQGKCNLDVTWCT